MYKRQSEELPLHRVLDLAILTCRAQLYLREDCLLYTSCTILLAPDPIPDEGVVTP